MQGVGHDPHLATICFWTLRNPSEFLSNIRKNLRSQAQRHYSTSLGWPGRKDLREAHVGAGLWVEECALKSTFVLFLDTDINGSL